MSLDKQVQHEGLNAATHRRKKREKLRVQTVNSLSLSLSACTRRFFFLKITNNFCKFRKDVRQPINVYRYFSSTVLSLGWKCLSVGRPAFTTCARS